MIIDFEERHKRAGLEVKKNSSFLNELRLELK